MIAASAMLAASCGDDTDVVNNTTPDKTPTTTVDINSTNWPFEKWGNPQVSPGDDFFSYCNGAWYDAARVGYGTTYESLVTIHHYFDQNYYLNNPLPSLLTLTADTVRVDEPAVQQLSKAYTQQWLERIDDAESHEELGKVMGELIKVGYEPLVKTYLINWQGNIVIVVMSPGILGDEEEDDFRHSRLLDARFTSTLPIDAGTRSDDEMTDVLDGIASSLGIKVGKELFCFSDDDELEEILTKPLDELKEEMKHEIIDFDAPYTSRTGAEEAGHSSYLYYISHLYEKYMNYEVARYLYDKKFYDADHQARVKELCREVLSTLSSRIDKLTWMDMRTKSQARKKVQTMKFFVGYPDMWLDDGIPQLTGACMVEDVHQLITAHFNISRHVLGKLITLAASYLCPQMNNIATDNAFYQPAYNTFFIFPNYMFEPYFREDVIDAHLYGMVAAVIGHEVVHGFDDHGAMYDSQGNNAVSEETPYGWWQESDYNEYVRRQKLLINSYNNLPFEPWSAPGAMNDGEKCLGENLADVGGLEVALECYNNHIAKQGYTGEAVKDLQRLFFKAFAYSWRTKYDKSIVDYLMEKDVHSSYYARVIGSTQNCDTWYDVFDVKQGQTYYLSPTLRCHVW